MLFSRECDATPGFMRLESPDKQYALVLVQKGDDPDDWENRELRVLRGNHELAHYPYEGVLVEAYWLLSRKLVVLDNHNGEAGFGILVVSLADGSIITGHGPTRSPDYDRIEDTDYLPDLVAAGHAQFRKVYPGVDGDYMSHLYASVAYGWTPEQRIKVYARLVFDELVEKEEYVFHVNASLEVTDQRKLKWQDVSVRKVKCDRNEPQPPEVTGLDKLLD
jgi:hypothetical protein